MQTRVGEQLATLSHLKATGTAQVTAQPVLTDGSLMESGNAPMKLEEQVQQVADRVTEMIKQQVVDKSSYTAKGDAPR
jgi:hypothetical protein